MKKDKITLLIVDDSEVSCQLLTYILKQEPIFNLIGCVSNGQQALEFVKKVVPDVIIMDIHMPKMDGFEATREIMRRHPIPIIISSAYYQLGDVNKSFQAIEAGALAILQKPKSITDPDFKKIAEGYIQTVKTVAEVKLITRTLSSNYLKASSASVNPLTHSLTDPELSHSSTEIIAIGASLGGPQALQLILAALPPDFSLPIFIVQHIAIGFTEGFVEWLKNSTKLTLKIGEDNEKIQKGFIYVAPSNRHLEVAKGRLIKISDASPDKGLRPSVAHLFQSVADVYGAKGTGIILTGMGSDGAAELLAMKKRGAITVAQSEKNCVLFGMPREAIQMGAACHVIDLDKIASFMIHLAESSTALSKN